MAVKAITNLQFYASNVEIEHEASDLLVTLTGIDVSDIVGQVTLDDMLDNVELDRIQDYLIKRLKEDAE